jgi:GTP-binding protein
VDKVQIECKGGKGGNGCISFEKLTPVKKRPTGGSGGTGGNVHLVTDKVRRYAHYHSTDGWE